MAKNSLSTPTKTIAFRVRTSVANSITKAAKEKGITVQEYFLSQISPESELGHILRADQLKMLEESQNISNARDRMANEALQLRESLGLSEEAFEAAAMQAFKLLMTGNRTDSDQAK